MTPIDVGGEELGVRARWLSAKDDGADDGAVVALLALSIDDAVRLPGDLQIALLAITLLGFIGFGFGSVFTARRVTHAAALALPNRPPSGSAPATTRRRSTGSTAQDEIGELAQSFERMRVDIAEKQAADPAPGLLGPADRLPNRARSATRCSAAMTRAARTRRSP